MTMIIKLIEDKEEQIVNLPEKRRINSDEVFISRVNDAVFLV